MTPHGSEVAPSDAPQWRAFAHLSFEEAAFVASRSSCDPASLRVTCIPGRTGFAVAGQDGDGGWHWAVFSAQGIMLDWGCEHTLAEAERVAIEARELWAHRCDAGRRCRCPPAQAPKTTAAHG